MGIFTRFKDIVSANMNAMLDRAEDPEKMIKLMIREMEETLVELKSACAGAMADVKRVGRELEVAREKERLWEGRASLAVQRGRDDLAREALNEKLFYSEKTAALEEEAARFETLIEQSQQDIAVLEEKLQNAKEKKRILVQRHIRADVSRRARQDVRRAASEEAMARFEDFERRIERMEAEADMVLPPRRRDLEHEFVTLEGNQDVEAQLQALKDRVAGGK
ncbi:MAG: phage shock protein PspA [Desulfovibrio sp.]|nr:phage shock protein PspA [Desulfovibrio sp.]MCA1987334.1 phage shock protein PspA [Desulfovibrio sp.]